MTDEQMEEILTSIKAQEIAQDLRQQKSEDTEGAPEDSEESAEVVNEESSD